MTFRKLFASSTFFLIFASTTALAQQADTPPQEVDEIISSGTIRGGDPAMSAFFSGDFETAEIEFEKNFRNLKRADMIIRESAEATRGNAALTDVRAGTPQIGSQGGAVSGKASTQINLSGLNINSRETGEGVKSGTDRGFQLYMMGLSQIQLKKYAEAKNSLRRALVLNKGIYDAHMRLGVLYLRDGEIDKARKEYKKLQKIDRRCKNICDGKDDVALGLKVLGLAIKHS
jgi:tetratricopeptide (TPR) repeat protein